MTTEEKVLELEKIKTLMKLYREMYDIGTLSKEQYDRYLCDFSMKIKEM